MRVAGVVDVPLPVRPVGGGAGPQALLERTWPTVEHTRALGRAGVDAHLYLRGLSDQTRELGPSATVHFCATSPIAAAQATRPDVLHVFHLLGLKALMTAVMGDAPVFAEYNGGGVPAGRIRRYLMRDATRGTRGLFFTARDIAEPFRRAGAIAKSVPIWEVPELSSRLPYPVEPREHVRARAGYSGAPDVLIVARIEEPKDPLCALEAFERIRVQRPQARLTWASTSGRQRSAVDAKLGQNRALAEAVRFVQLSSAAEMADLYVGADVMLHTSTREVCGTAFMEAMGAGLPVAASRIPAFAAMAHPECVRLSPIGYAQAFADAALALLDAEDARAAAQDHFRDKLCFDAIARRRVEGYTKLL